MGKDPAAQIRLVIVSPVYEDAASATKLIEELAGHFSGSDLNIRILMVDDGSTKPLSDELVVPDTAQNFALDVLLLRRNVGHQRAIALGTAFVHDQIPCDAMLVMDADGEDRPEDAARLLEHFRKSDLGHIIFAERTRRTESGIFRGLYRLYQVMHWLLTGIKVRVGNFSIVPARCLPTLVTLPAMWNHYAAAIFQSRLSFDTIPTQRGTRYSGRSKMNYLSLVMHGLNAISVFGDLVAVRFLIAVFALSCLCGVMLVVSLVTHFVSNSDFPVWAVYGGGTLLILLLLTVGCFSLVLNLMSQRNNLDFIPIRDYKYFVDRVIRLAPPHE